MGSSRDIVQYKTASGRSIPFPDDHNLNVCMYRNLQLWGSYPAGSAERNIVGARVCGLFGDSYYQDAQGFVTLLTQDQVFSCTMRRLTSLWNIHLRNVELDALVEVKERVFPHACRKVGPDTYQRYVNYRVSVESDGFERNHLNIPGKFIVHLINVIYLMLSIYNISLMLHLGDITLLPTWLGYNELGPEHHGYLPTDHELSHKLSILSPLAIPARRLAQDGITPNRIYYYDKKGKQHFLKLICGNRYPKLSFRGQPMSMHHMVAILWGAPNNTGLPMTADTFHFFEVDHIDGDKLNWDIDNLQWVIGKANRDLYKAMRKSKLH